MHEFIAPRPNLFHTRLYKVVPPVERAHIVQELRTTSTKLVQPYIIQHSSGVIDLLPKTENSGLRIIVSVMIRIG